MLLQNRVTSVLLTTQPKLSVGQAESMLRRWFIEDKGASEVGNVYNTACINLEY